MYSLLKKALFLIDPETAHDLVKKGFKLAPKNFLKSFTEVNACALKAQIGPFKLSNPVGLAAGFDKNGSDTDLAGALGFGFLEIGSVTARKCVGNPRPRIFRLPADESLVNFMGLPNSGADAVFKNLSSKAPSIPFGINIAKTPGPFAGLEDLMTSFQKLNGLGGYFVFNLSCPNTEDGKTFEDPDLFRELALLIKKERQGLKVEKPVLVKLSPQLEKKHLRRIIEIADDCGIDGFVVSNTTLSFPPLKTQQRLLEKIKHGALSGKGLEEASNDRLSKVYEITGNRKILIGVGGILDFRGLITKLSLGASLFQVYTGLVYKGPFFARTLNKQLADFCKRLGVKNYLELRGQKEILKRI